MSTSDDVAALVERLTAWPQQMSGESALMHEAAAALTRLGEERDEVRMILASTDIVSLPHDYPTANMAQDRIDRINDLTLEGLAMIGRAEKAEDERDRCRQEFDRQVKLQVARAEKAEAEVVRLGEELGDAKTFAVHMDEHDAHWKARAEKAEADCLHWANDYEERGKVLSAEKLLREKAEAALVEMERRADKYEARWDLLNGQYDDLKVDVEWGLEQIKALAAKVAVRDKRIAELEAQMNELGSEPEGDDLPKVFAQRDDALKRIAELLRLLNSASHHVRSEGDDSLLAAIDRALLPPRGSHD